MSLMASAASMATIQTTTLLPTHQVTKSTSPSSLIHTRDLPPKSRRQHQTAREHTPTTKPDSGVGGCSGELEE